MSTESRQEPCLVIGTPCFGRQLTDLYVNSLLKLQMACFQRGLRLQIKILGGDALITRVRQNILAYFLSDSTSTHLLFVDADIGFEPEQVFRLLDFDADVSAAIYPIKRLDWNKVASAVNTRQLSLESSALSYMVEFTQGDRIEVRDGFAQVQYAGTGFFMVKKQAVMAMVQHYPELRYAHDHRHDDKLAGTDWRYALFDCMIDEETKTYLSEDFAFCRRWTGMGGQIWADLTSKLTHTGSFSFKGDIATQFTNSGTSA